MASPSEPWFPLSTHRLLLRDFSFGDFDDVQTYGSDPDVVQYLPWGPNTPQDTQAFLERVVQTQSTSPRLDFDLAVSLSATGQVIGSVALRLYDPRSSMAEIGYCLHRCFWRQGLTSEAAEALLDVGFRILGLHRIIATCDTRNTGSSGVLEKLGMRREGWFRQDRQVKSEWCDNYLYALLAEEWRRPRPSG